MTRRIAVVAVLLMIFSVVTSVANADDVAYMESGASVFGTVDLNTGVFTPIAATPTLVGGLAAFNGNFYGWGNGPNTVYKIDPSTGSETAVGSGTLSSGVGNMSSSANGVFGLDALSGNLYSINPNNGASTFISALGITVTSGNGLGNTIYVWNWIGSTDSALYSVNTITGIATFIGNTGFGFLDATVWVNGTLYAGNSYRKFFTLDPNTGVGTFVSDLSGVGNDIWGLGVLIQSPTPEPSSILLLGSGLLGVIGVARRRLAHR